MKPSRRQQTPSPNAATLDRTVVAVDARPLITRGNGVSRLVIELVSALRDLGSVDLILVSHRPLHRDHDLAGLRVVVDHGWHRVPGTLWYMARMNALARRHGAHVVWGTAHVLPFRRDGLRYVVSLHDLVHLMMPASMQIANLVLSRFLVGRSLVAADAVATLSQTTRSDLLSRLPVDPNRVVTILPGVSAFAEAEDPAVQPAWLPAQFLFALGSLEPRKNIDGLLRCFVQLSQLRPDLVLVITGAHQWKSQRVLKLLEEPALKGRVIRTGYLSDADIARNFAKTQAFIMSSHYEGFGLPVLEAAGHCPIVLSAVPVFNELATYVAGVKLVNFHDPATAAWEIDGFLASQPAQARVRSEWEQELNWTRAAQQYVDLFKSVLTNGHAQSAETNHVRHPA